MLCVVGGSFLEVNLATWGVILATWGVILATWGVILATWRVIFGVLEASWGLLGRLGGPWVAMGDFDPLWAR